MASREQRIAALAPAQRLALARRLAGHTGAGPGAGRLVAFVVAETGARLAEEELRDFARERLAEYMVPPLFVELDALPRTAAGKLDRAALQTAQGRAVSSGAGEAAGYAAPRTEAETVLARIWAQALGLDEVGVHDDFFEVGGDSLLSIRILARANQEGLSISPEAFFAHPTIAGQAALVGAATASAGDAGPVTGEAPLTPIQHWFFERIPIDPQHWNQSLLLSLPPALDFETTRNLLAHLVARHETLRAVFSRGEQGWLQRFLDPGQVPPGALLQRIDGPDAGALEQAAQRLHQGFDLGRCPLLGAAWRAGEERNELLLVVHHLALDALSWQFLVEDLETLVAQALDGVAVAIPVPATSFKAWAERLVEHAGGAALQRELDYWLQPAPGAGGVPADHAAGAGENLVLSAETVCTSLDAVATRRLLHEVPGRVRAQVSEVLLAALVHAVTRASGAPGVTLDLEGHGREALFDGCDVSRTVGWFTTVFPVHLEADPSGDPLATLLRVKERLRAIPGRGIGYGLLRELTTAGAALREAPPSELLFNYLGQVDGHAPSRGLVKVEREGVGDARSARGLRAYAIEINARISGETLRLDWAYSTRLHERTSIEALAAGFDAALEALIAGSEVPGAVAVSPSDFPLADLDQGELDGLAQMLDEIDARPPGAT